MRNSTAKTCAKEGPISVHPYFAVTTRKSCCMAGAVHSHGHRHWKIEIQKWINYSMIIASASTWQWRHQTLWSCLGKLIRPTQGNWIQVAFRTLCIIRRCSWCCWAPPPVRASRGRWPLFWWRIAKPGFLSTLRNELWNHSFEFNMFHEDYSSY